MLKENQYVTLPNGRKEKIESINKLGIVLESGWIGVFTETYKHICANQNVEIREKVMSYLYIIDTIKSFMRNSQGIEDSILSYNEAYSCDIISDLKRIRDELIYLLIKDKHTSQFKDTTFGNGLDDTTLKFVEKSVSHIDDKLTFNTIIDIFYSLRNDALNKL